jgi:hypothetical protein
MIKRRSRASDRLAEFLGRLRIRIDLMDFGEFRQFPVHIGIATGPARPDSSGRPKYETKLHQKRNDPDRRAARRKKRNTGNQIRPPQTHFPSFIQTLRQMMWSKRQIVKRFDYTIFFKKLPRLNNQLDLEAYPMHNTR